MRITAFYDRPPEQEWPRLPRLAADLLAAGLPGLRDAVPAYRSLYVELDADLTSVAEVRAWLAGYRAAPGVRGRTGQGGPEESGEGAAEETVTVIPVCYDGEDLPEVARLSGLSEPDVVALHSGETYTVRALGFVAGFPFMETTPAPLRLPRRAAPRAQVPAHSLAIAGAQTGIYPVAAPGGWNLLGRTLVPVYDPRRERPFLVEPGQRVRFRPVPGMPDPLPPPEPLLLWPETPAHPLVRVHRAGALGLLMDRGRFQAGRYGLVRSGVLDTQAAALANDLLGNAPDCAVLELHLTGPQLELLAPGVLACAGRGLRAHLNGQPMPAHSSFAAQPGDRLTFTPTGEGRLAYLAVQGGFETRPFMGSASTDLKGGLGRALQAGDVFGSVGSAWNGFHLPRQFTPYEQPGAPLRLLPVGEGEAQDPADLAALCEAKFTLRDLDRMAARLSGPALRGGEITSEAAPVGTIQVTPSGEPLILLNDKGTLGGYRKPARVHPADLPRLVQTLPGQPVRFTAG